MVKKASDSVVAASDDAVSGSREASPIKFLPGPVHLLLLPLFLLVPLLEKGKGEQTFINLIYRHLLQMDIGFLGLAGPAFWSLGVPSLCQNFHDLFFQAVSVKKCKSNLGIFKT